MTGVGVDYASKPIWAAWGGVKKRTRWTGWMGEGGFALRSQLRGEVKKRTHWAGLKKRTQVWVATAFLRFEANLGGGVPCTDSGIEKTNPNWGMVDSFDLDLLEMEKRPRPRRVGRFGNLGDTLLPFSELLIAT